MPWGTDTVSKANTPIKTNTQQASPITILAQYSTPTHSQTVTASTATMGAANTFSKNFIEITSLIAFLASAYRRPDIFARMSPDCRQ